MEEWGEEECLFYGGNQEKMDGTDKWLKKDC